MILSFLAHLYSTEFNFRRRTIPPHEKCYKSFRKEQAEKKEERDLEQSFENAGMKREGRRPLEGKAGAPGVFKAGEPGSIRGRVERKPAARRRRAHAFALSQLPG